MEFNHNVCSGFAELPLPVLDRVGWPWTDEALPSAEKIVDGMSWPKISVVTPSYNQGQFIEQTVRSVLLQRYPNLEFIIIDGGSTDQTIEIIRKYEPWLAYWVSEPDQGQSHAINKGIQKASGDILLWLNSDDICLPGSFHLVAQIFRKDSNLRLISGQAHMIDPQGRMIGELRSQFTSWDELATNPRNSVRQISTFFSRSLFDELGFIDENLHIAMDTDLLVRFTQFHTPFILNTYLTAYRLHADAKTSTQLIKGYEESDRTRIKYLTNKELAASYHKRSARNWLSLSESDQLSLSMRWISLSHAVHQQPSILFSRFFLYSVKKLILANV